MQRTNSTQTNRTSWKSSRKTIIKSASWKKTTSAKYSSKSTITSERSAQSWKNAVHTVEHVLNSLQADFDNGIIATKGEVTAWRDFFPRITRIEAKASSNALKSNEPIFVTVTAVYKGITKTFGVQWTPNSKSKPYDLYKAIGDPAKGSFPVPAGSS